MAVITDVTDALVAELNAVSLSVPLTAARHYVPLFELQDMKDLRVSVVPTLGQLIECFLSQDYPSDQREVIILDDAGQHDNQEGDGWQLASIPLCFRSLGEKRSACAALASPDAEGFWSQTMTIFTCRIGSAPRPRRCDAPIGRGLAWCCWSMPTAYANAIPAVCTTAAGRFGAVRSTAFAATARTTMAWTRNWRDDCMRPA